MRRLTKKWILEIVPEIERGKLKVSGKLVSSVYPAYVQYRKLKNNIERLENEGVVPQKKIEFLRQVISDYYQSISAIKDIGNSEGLDVGLSPNVRRIEERIKKTKKSVSFWEKKLSAIVKSKEEYKQQELAVESEARKIIANWVTGLGTELGEDIKKIIEKEAKERENAEQLTLEIIDAIKDAAKKTKDQDKLIALRFLQEDVLDLINEFRNDRISYNDFKRDMAEKRDEVRILSQDDYGGRNEKFDNNPRETYYDILGISPDASQEEIRKAYHRKVHEYHPDKFIGQPDWVKKQSEEMTKKINIAYNTLKSPEEREKYNEEIL